MKKLLIAFALVVAVVALVGAYRTIPTSKEAGVTNQLDRLAKEKIKNEYNGSNIHLVPAGSNALGAPANPLVAWGPDWKNFQKNGGAQEQVLYGEYTVDTPGHQGQAFLMEWDGSSWDRKGYTP